jgi:hypothetical protein
MRKIPEYVGFMVWIPAYAGMTAYGGFVALKAGLEMRRGNDRARRFC